MVTSPERLFHPLPLPARAGVLVALAVLLAAGCGDRRAEYEREVAPIASAVDERLQQFDRESGDTVDAEQLSVLSDDLRELANQLDDIEPPAEVEYPHEELVAGLRKLSAALAALSNDLAATDDRLVQAQLYLQFGQRPGVRDAWRRIGAARRGFEERGYRVFAPSERESQPGSSAAVDDRQRPHAAR